MKSMMMVTVTPRLAASAVTASICVLLPSIRAAQVRRCRGSRRSASSNAAAMTAGMSSVTEAVSHLPLACGSRGFPFPLAFAARVFFFSLLRGRADDVFRGARDGHGVVDAGQLGHPLAAVFSPVTGGCELALGCRGGLRGGGPQRAGRITMPFPSKVSTSA